MDDNLLYCIYRNAIDFLFTHDQGIKLKSIRLGLEDRVLNVDELLAILRGLSKKSTIEVAPLTIKNEFLHNLKITDPFFESLKVEYPSFENWFNRKSRDGEKAWVYLRENNTLGAFLLLKEENETIELKVKSLPKTERIKISTLKVAEQGYKIGELFIKIAIEHAISKSIEEIYLTHFEKPNDYLVN